MTLPTEKTIAKSENPRFLLLFGKPKSGKTTLVAKLDNGLIIDLEGGSEYLECMSVQARTVKDLAETAKALREANKPYDYLIIDSGTKLEEVAIKLAGDNYRKSAIGSKWTGSDIRDLPHGAGYKEIRKAFQYIIDLFKDLTPHLILICHANEKTFENSDGAEYTEMWPALSGQLAALTCQDADAIGYVYREKNRTMVSFEGGGKQITEARPLHIRGQKFVLAESDENNSITTKWEQIYKEN